MMKPLKILFAAAALVSVLALCGCGAEPTLTELEDAAYAALDAGDASKFQSAFLAAEQAYPSELKSELYRSFIEACGSDLSDPQALSACLTLLERGELEADELVRFSAACLDSGETRLARELLELAARRGAQEEADAMLSEISVDFSLEPEHTAELLKSVCKSAAEEDLASLLALVSDTDWLNAVMPPYDGGIRRYTDSGAELAMPAEVTASVVGGLPVTEVKLGTTLAARVTPDTAALINCERSGGSYSGQARILLLNLSTGVYYTVDCTLEDNLLSGSADFSVYTLPEGETPAQRLAAVSETPDGTYSGSFSAGSPGVQQRASSNTVTVGYNRGKTYYLNLDVPEGMSKADGVGAAWLYVPEA